MIKYLGSKRRLVPVLGSLFEASGAETALDLFSGTTRVAQEFKRRGGLVTTLDSARYSDVLARTYVVADRTDDLMGEVQEAIARLASLPGVEGYFTKTFCLESRFFQPENGMKVDAIREAIESGYRGTHLYPILLTSLMEAADRVDSTTGLQMAYLKSWAPRSYKPLELRVPDLIPGRGASVLGDAVELVPGLERFGLAYLDPPYNQHRYFTNYHIWETLIAWDAPEYYGVACKRLDCRDEKTKSVFNRKRAMPGALAEVVRAVNAEVIVLSYNDESWISRDGLEEMCEVHGSVRTLSFESQRYVGAQIGIHDPAGNRVGKVSHLRNSEYLVVAGRPDVVDRMVEGFENPACVARPTPVRRVAS